MPAKPNTAGRDREARFLRQGDIRESSRLDPLIHERLRLGVLSTLSVNESLSFRELKEQLAISGSNLTFHARKLENAGYVVRAKSRERRNSDDQFRLTDRGRRALERYLDYMESLIGSAVTGPEKLTPRAVLARHVLTDLHDPETGRLDAKRIASYLHVSLSSLAAITGGSVAAIHKAPAASSLQQALAPIARTISVLTEVLHSKEQVLAWLNSPHPDLGNQIPLQFILGGHAVAVADLVDAALAGQPS